ncbi:uncharacterized protein METZ01_LOCUS246890 [marine metagenome]|uniref:Uncharacterized protein n=1 Tax=marine metagenome TaxID=408172 RepID=A0A382I353_9ZZZZ
MIIGKHIRELHSKSASDSSFEWLNFLEQT